MTPQSVLRAMFDRAVAVADPMRVVAEYLPTRPAGRTIVIGAGKASARMAEAVEAVWGACDGLVITRYGYGRPTKGIRIVEAAHPVPDQAGIDATAQMLTMLDGLGPDDLVLALISGGASSLLTQPAGQMTLDDMRAVNAALLASGAPIGQMNVLRKNLCLAKGGRLAAAAHPARVVTLMISDVPGDDPALIGSGPTVGDPNGPDVAREIAARWRIALPDAAMAALDHPDAGPIPPDDARLSLTENHIISAPSQSLEAAAALARDAGYPVEILGDAIEGEAREIAAEHARIAKAATGAVVILSGGELTVTRRGDGIGGPNAEYALALALALDGAAGIHAIACDTDGVDGAAEVAGAIIGPQTIACHIAEAEAALAVNDAHSFFAEVNAQVVTGPTLTNVNDFRAILVEG